MWGGEWGQGGSEEEKGGGERGSFFQVAESVNKSSRGGGREDSFGRGRSEGGDTSSPSASRKLP